MWDEKKVPYWINEICEKAMQSLDEQYKAQTDLVDEELINN